MEDRSVAVRLPGGAAVRGVLLLAFVSIAGATLWGCHARRPVAPGLRYVRIETLLSLHPSWQQVDMIRREAEQFAASQPPPDGIVLELPGLPSNFTPPQKVPPNLVDERRKRLRDEAARYVDIYSEQLSSRNDAIYAQEAKTARVNTEATYQRELAARRNSLQEAANARAGALIAAKERLQYRIVGLRSQISAYTAQARTDAVSQRDRLRTEVAKLDQERIAVLAAVESNAVEQMKPERQRLEAELTNQLAERKSQLDQEAKDMTARELARLSRVPDPIPAIGTTPPPERYLHETPLPLPTPQQTVQAVQTAQEKVDSRSRELQNRWQSRQNRLISLIRADTEQAAEQIAREHGWKLVPFGTRGAVDATAVVASAIRAQWQIH